MSNESDQQPCMVISMEEYKFQLEDANEPDGFVEYKGRMEVSYDGNLLGIDTWEVPVDADFTDSPIQQLTLVGSNQANLLVGSILALLEAYNEPSVFNDENIKEEYEQMVQEAKNSNAEKTVGQLEE